MPRPVSCWPSLPRTLARSWRPRRGSRASKGVYQDPPQWPFSGALVVLNTGFLKYIRGEFGGGGSKVGLLKGSIRQGLGV